MTLNVHIVNVGQGNMILLHFPDNKVICYDCNITEDNEQEVFSYLKKVMPKKGIDIFINSHRDSDHMRGIEKLHEEYPISSIWDSGISANTEAPEYQTYMRLKRDIPSHEITPNQVWTHNNSLKILNGKRDNDDPNSQSIVLHVDYEGSSILLPGDTDAPVWKDFIMKESGNNIKSCILLASHHGSRSFIDHDSYEHYYVDHIKSINPDMTIISVGDNPHGHPDDQAIKYYEKYSNGSDQGNKVFTTKDNGNIHIQLKGNGSWSLNQNQ
ncbi:MAG: MBL fold metallo-hydrolase [Nanoarchaeota archaeon]|nr:MBL fold metallo-hydrolase [Nanoarchaeota archaeon]MBU1622971.1 MBL fold metallo-hydrolase [Nanoarchaeota archaeon]